MLKRILEHWDRILFKPISTNAVCIFRIGLGIAVLLATLLRFPDFLMWYGQKGLTLYAHLPATEVVDIWQFIPPTDTNLWLAMNLEFVFGLTLTLGLFTRFSTLAAYVLYTSFRTRSPFLWFSIDCSLHIFLPLMLLAPAGEKFSLDQWLRKKFNKNYQEKLACPFAQRLMQWAVATIYLRGFLSKIVVPDWTGGTNALNYSIHSEWIKHGLPSFFETQLFYQLGTFMTFAIEFALFTLIWFRQTRYWTLAAGAVFHVLLNYVLNIDFLEYVMVASYGLFIYPEDLAHLLQRLHLPPGPQD